MNELRRPIVGITMGDPLGIGPEIILKSFLEGEVLKTCKILVIGDRSVMENTAGDLNFPVKVRGISNPSEAVFDSGMLDVLDLTNIDFGRFALGRVEASAGKAAVEYLKKAGNLAMEGKIDAIASAPVNKEAMRLAGFNYPGQTEILAELTKTKDFCMLLVSGSIRIIPVTTHLSLRKALDLITRERVLKFIKFAEQGLSDLGLMNGKIGVSGVNPHAGEGGAFGEEETNEIIPAIEEAKKRGINVEGPIAADVIFLRMKEKNFDIVLVMYHDHGNILVKALGIDASVTILIGLPIIRTSVVHGTAFDIAGKGVANIQSFTEAIKMAAHMARVRKFQVRNYSMSISKL